MTTFSIGSKFLFIEGHANFAEHGKDIVCAGISFGSQMLIEQLKHNKVECKHKITTGEKPTVAIEWKENCQKAKSFIEPFSNMIKALEKQYPLNLKVFEID